ncbi:hypothetical protein Tco_1215105 [Tanacetum coccineum]
MNQNYFEPNPSYSGFDQPSQYPIDQSPPQEMSIQDMEDLKQQYLDEIKSMINQIRIKYYHNERIDIRYRMECEIKIDELKGKFNGMSIKINKKKELRQLEQAANVSTHILEPSTPDFLITDSLIMEDEHLDTIPEMESDEENEFSVEDLNLTLSDDDESLSNKDVPEENFKIYSNPLFDEEIISTKIDPHHFNVESDLIEYLLNRDILIVSSPKFDSFLEEFSGELAHIDLISPEIDEADFDPEEEIRLVEKLLYEDLTPRPPEEFNFENSDAVIESFSPSPIPVEGSDSLMEKIDIFLAPDDSIPSGIENDDYDSEGDILFLGEFLTHDPLSLPENESFHFDRYYVPSSPRPPEKPPDDDDVYFDIEPDT